MKLSHYLVQRSALISMGSLLYGIIVACLFWCHTLKMTGIDFSNVADDPRDGVPHTFWQKTRDEIGAKSLQRQNLG
jgi:hypothetical protein